MDDLLKDLTDKLKAAMKAQDKTRTSVLRMVLAEIKVAEKSGKDFKYSDIPKSYAKKLKKAIDEYKKLGSDDNVKALKEELTIVEEFLPEQMSDEELTKVVDEVLSSNNFTGSDMGKAMGLIMKKCGDVVDGKKVQALVKEKLC